MLSSTAQWLLFAQMLMLGVAAHRDWLLQGLSECWQECLSSGEGCDSRRCICRTSEDSSAYLPSAVACARSDCNADTWELDLFLGPLQLYCKAIDCAMPEDVVNGAYAAASGAYTSSTTTRYIHSSTKTNAPKPTSTNSDDDHNEPTSTVTTTYTKTTTDGDGNTLQIIVPIVMGPTGISTGATITSTVGGSTSPTETPSTAQASGPTTQGASPTSASGSEETESPANGNGSPFENMQAGAGTWTVSVPVFGLSAFATLFICL